MPDGFVVRQRLLDALSDRSPVRIVSAPSGFGKTTLLRSWVESLPTDGRRVVWVTLTAAVTTARDFWQLVGDSALHREETGLGSDPAGDGTWVARIAARDDPVPDIAGVLDHCGPLLLVLDAYEQLRGLTDRIDDDLLRLTDAVTGLEVVVSTRAATRLEDEVSARGGVRLIDENDLRFTVDEVEQLLAPHARDAATRIVDDTHGHPLGVRAAAYALGRPAGAPSFDNHAWQRLVSADLRLRLADPELAEFVLDTSVPPYFDAELAGQLTGDGDIDVKLAELAWHRFGRWVPGRRERPTFRYIESVRDAFCAQLRGSDPERHHRNAGLAAAWLHACGDHDPALTLALDAADHELAADICRSLVVASPDAVATESLERELRRVPAHLLPDHPTLAFVKATVCAANPTTRAAARECFEVAADHALDGIESVSAPEAAYRHVGRAVCLRRLGRTPEATIAAERALELLDTMGAADREALGEFPAIAAGLLAFSFFDAGETTLAATIADRATAAARSQRWRDHSRVVAAAIQALDGRSSSAAAASGTRPAELSSRPGRRPHALAAATRAVVELDRLDFAAARRALGDADGRPDSVGVWPLLSWVRLHAELGTGCAADGAHRISEALAARPVPAGVGANLGTTALLNGLAIAWLATGHGGEARRILAEDVASRAQLAPALLLDQLLQGEAAAAARAVGELLSEAGHTGRSTAATETLGAAAVLRIGNARLALELLDRAARRYRASGVRAHLLYLPCSDLEALRQLAAESGGHRAAYLAGPVASPIEAASARPVQLTPREIEVLATWARHRTRAAVAAELFVSTNTVRSQLNSAYRKLGVATKDAAIQRAIALDLFAVPRVHAEPMFASQ